MQITKDIVIKVEDLGKKYIIGHQTKNNHYVALRDVLMQSVHTFWSKAKDLVMGRPIIQGDTLEEIWALRNASFEIKKGETVGIIGRNGAGKSTLLKVFSRITEPSAGRVTIKGRVASLLEVGTGFHPELTGRENIFLNGAVLGMSHAEIKRKFDEIVAFAEVEQFLDTPVKRYSSGMYVRLAFAIAAHLEPEILVVDEVLAVGDVEFQKKCLGKMESVARQGRTVLFVSHNMLAIRTLCTRCIVFDKGKNIFHGDVSSAIDVYLSNKIDTPGEIVWNEPSKVSGNDLVRLNAVRVISDGKITGHPCVNKDIEIQIDYWNCEENGRRFVAIQVGNAMSFIVFTTNNLKVGSIVYDPWASKPYPAGLFRSTCIIPKYLLNIGMHHISLFINGGMISDNIITQTNVLSFDVQEDLDLRKEYSGALIGAVRPILAWKTEQLK